MNSYTKPNIILPVSLHDARVSDLRVFPASPNKADGIIIFVFENGFYNAKEADMCQTGRATVKFSGVDFDFSHVAYIKENYKQKKCFEELVKDIQIQSFDVLDETYGYNLTKLTGNMISSDSWCEVEIEIYHFNDILYEWLNNPER